MFFTESHVLVVDDEPDVLSVSKLAMRNLQVFGLPIRVHTAMSKAEAVELLNTTLATDPPGNNLLSVAFIDVVMETDQAGLELCEYIREELNLRFAQLYVRTGQPGIAPQREVIDRYDINGYLSKVEATDDKLYTLVKGGVRQAHFTKLALLLQDALHALIHVSRTRQWMVAELNKYFDALQADLSRRNGIDVRACYIVDDRVVAGTWGVELTEALTRKAELADRPGVPLSADGDHSFSDGNDVSISIAPTSVNAEIHYLMRGIVPTPDWDIILYHKFSRSLAALWKRAA
jgi:CheY-like chemotaxis protein